MTLRSVIIYLNFITLKYLPKAFAVITKVHTRVVKKILIFTQIFLLVYGCTINSCKYPFYLFNYTKIVNESGS